MRLSGNVRAALSILSALDYDIDNLCSFEKIRNSRMMPSYIKRVIK